MYAERQNGGFDWRWLALGGICLLVYFPTLTELVLSWLAVPEFSHGLLIPWVIAYILWENRADFRSDVWHPSRWAVLLCVVSQVLLVVATLADLDRVKFHALWLTIVSLVWATGGTELLRRLAFPLLLLLTAIPLPYLLNKLLTLQLQQLSSDLGVQLIRLFGMPVFQDGNIIQMGKVQLLVAEACSGLRYLLPLFSISLILAYFFRGPLWIKLSMVMLAAPLTVIMNSIRIAVTGVLIDLYGDSAAQGFLHAFEGWVVFLAALLMLLACIFLLTRLLPGRLPFSGYFKLPADAPAASGASMNFSASLMVCAGVLLVTASVLWMSTRKLPAVELEREPFSRLPFTFATRHVQVGELDAEVAGVLKADDYFMGNYVADGQIPVNLYMAYYARQADGAAIHSPRDCLPAGNWNIQSLEQVDLPAMRGKSNRAVIRKGDETLLVYYWIHQQGENYANEFTARLMLLRDAVSRNRTDASLIRVAIPVRNADLADSERQLRAFVEELAADLPRFLPGRNHLSAVTGT